MGDFLGFTFGDKKSADLGITRVSGGDRYDEELHPEIKDRTAEVPGLNGQYYFGSDFGTRPFDLEIAYDHLTEQQFRELKRVFGTKDIKKLVFDERPYKYYMVKIGSPIELSYICFDEPKKVVGAQRDGVRRTTRIEEEPVIDEETQEPVIDEETGEPITQTVVYRDLEQVTPYETQEGTERIYKGEGKISFIAYFPFAKSAYKQIPLEEQESDWAVSSGMFFEPAHNEQESAEPTEADIIDKNQNGIIKVYNAGDIETGFRLYLPAEACNAATTLTYKFNNIDVTAQLALKPITLQSGDIGVIIDTNNNLVVGVTEFASVQGMNVQYTTSGHLYNECITAGYFFHLEPNDLYITSTLEITNTNENIEIFYDYLYF